MNIDLSEISADIEEETAPPEMNDKLVNIPYDSEVYLCSKTITRWRKTDDGLVRDYDGEADWREMSKYVDKTYEQVFMETYATLVSQASES